MASPHWSIRRPDPAVTRACRFSVILASSQPLWPPCSQLAKTLRYNFQVQRTGTCRGHYLRLPLRPALSPLLWLSLASAMDNTTLGSQACSI
jgi:hypothetical protein